MIDKYKIYELLCAQKSVAEILDEVKCSKATFYRIKALMGKPPIVRKPGQGRKRTVRTSKLIRSIKSKIRRNPVRSMRLMAREAGVSEKTVRRVVKFDLKAKSRVRERRHLITERIRRLRVERCKKLVSALKKGQPVIFFTDEKLFTVDSCPNRRNDRYISTDKASEPENVRFSSRTKHPAKVMMFGLIASDGKKMDPVFVESGVKINTDVYIDILETHVKPWIDANYGSEQKYLYQQDGAPAHTAKKTQRWLIDNMADFWSKDMWPPSSPDANPLDFSIWAFVEEKACKQSHASVSALKGSIQREWKAMTPDYIRKVCARFRPRLEAIIAADGNHIE